MRSASKSSSGQVKLAVTYRSGASISIEDKNLRIIVPTVYGPWTPPSPAGDIVEVTVQDGAKAFAIPANRDGSAESFSGSRTFTTHWPGGTLASGQAYTDSGDRKGDLVFLCAHGRKRLPTSARTGYLRKISGSAGELVGFASTSTWGPGISFRVHVKEAAGSRPVPPCSKRPLNSAFSSVFLSRALLRSVSGLPSQRDGST